MSRESKPLCVITARGGSKRIPRKNIRTFCGRPIIAYSIDAALASGLFQEVMVSTDDEEIAEVARSFGAVVPFLRSPATSGDFATTSDVLIEVLDAYQLRGREISALCCLYPTAPFVTAKKLREGAALFGHGADSVVTATRFGFPPQRGLVARGDCASFWMSEFKDARSQDLEPVYHDAGQFYFVESHVLRSARSVVGPSCRLLVVPESEVQDIDTQEDWLIAELKYQAMVARGDR